MWRIHLNGKEREIAEGTTVAGLLRELRLDGTPVAVELNGKIAAKDSQEQRILREKDVVEIVTVVGGG